jgi:hypothetical protein
VDISINPEACAKTPTINSELHADINKNQAAM